MAQSIAHRIGNRWEAGQADPYDDLDPSEQSHVVARAALLTAGQVREAIDAAALASEAWRNTSPIDRGAILGRAARLLRQERDAIARDISEENGKTLAEATVEVEKSADFMEFFGATARMPNGTLIADARPGTRTMTLLEPVGVVLAITPWNDPMLTPARKLSPALVAGNSVVLKPSRDTPLAAYHLVRALVEAGMPGGVVNTVMAEHVTLDEVALGDERVNAVTFTGSTDVGLGLHRKLAGRNVRLQTEMGGKNAAVVMADADLDLAVATIAAGAFGQAGQRCTATSRVIVERPAYAEVVKRLSVMAEHLRLGPSTDPRTTMGPVINRSHRDDVLARVDEARQSGGKVVTGGRAPAGHGLANGCFVEPTVISDVGPEMLIWRNEVFGPVIAVTPTDSLDDAIAAVNDSTYGLSAAIFTTNLRSSQRFIDRAEVGQVAVNLSTSGWDVHVPFGGFKYSGSPFKEQGIEALRFYTRIKTAALRFDW